MPARAQLPDSRARILAAAATEFAARGFEGTSVDRIARAARVNKAMIYYHFANKAALHTEIFRHFIEAVLAKARAIAASDAPPCEKIRAFVAAIAGAAEQHPHFPPMWLREIAGGGRHVDRATLDLVGQIPRTLGAIIDEGVRRGQFHPRHPLLLHFGIVGPLVLYYAAQPVLARAVDSGLRKAAAMPREQLVTHVEQATLAALTASAEPKGRRS